MSKLVALTWRELIKRLHELGFAGPYSGGKHLFMIKDLLRVTIPNPHKKQIGPDLLGRILRQAGVTRTEWEGDER